MKNQKWFFSPRRIGTKYYRGYPAMAPKIRKK